MKKLIVSFLTFAIMNSCQNKNDLMVSLLEKQKVAKDSLEYYNLKKQSLRLEVDTLTDSDLLKISDDFLSDNRDKQMKLIYPIHKWETEYERISYSIDSLNKIK